MFLRPGRGCLQGESTMAPDSSTPNPGLPPCRSQQLNIKFEHPGDPPSTTRTPAGFVLIIHLFPPSWECLTQLLPLSASTLDSPCHLPPFPSALLGLALTPAELCCQQKCQPLSLSKSFPAPKTEQGRSVLQRKTSHVIFSDSVLLLCSWGGQALVPGRAPAGAAWVTCSSTSLPFPEPAQV